VPVIDVISYAHFPPYQHSIFASDDPSDTDPARQTIILGKGLHGSLHNIVQESWDLAFAYSCSHVTGQRRPSSSPFFTHRCLINGEPRSMYGETFRGDCRRDRPAIDHCSAQGNREQTTGLNVSDYRLRCGGDAA